MLVFNKLLHIFNSFDQNRNAPRTTFGLPQQMTRTCHHSGLTVTILIDGVCYWVVYIVLDKIPPVRIPVPATSPLRSGKVQAALRGWQYDGDAQAGLPRHEGVCRVAPAALLVPTVTPAQLLSKS